MKGLKAIFYVVLIPFVVGISVSCSDSSYPCPGAGRSDAADMSTFNEDGQLKKGERDKKREARKDEHGIIKKDNPNKTDKKRKKYKRKKRKRMTR